MRCVTSILAHVLATSVVVACGGQTSDFPGGPDGPGGPSSSGGTASSGGTSSGGTKPVEPPHPTPRDAGVSDAALPDSGCTTPPELLRQGDCMDTWHHPCGIPDGVDLSDGLSDKECVKVCGAPTLGGTQYWGCAEHLAADLPSPSFDCYTCVEGRRPQGYVEREQEGTVAGWLAHAADLERVSIDAFQILARELAHHGAPADLIALANQAEADEVRHARVLGALARREGAALSSVPVKHGPVRSLVDIALENAVEGCIRETYGALVAGFQADHAKRTDVRRVMRQLYRDEAMHAALAWEVNTWIMDRLEPLERERVEDAMTAATAELTAAARTTTALPLVEALGLPRPDQACRLVEGLMRHLWKPALAA